LNISNILKVRKNPPKMLIEAKNMEIWLKMVTECVWLCDEIIMAPIMIMPDMALDTLINGECRFGVTPRTTK
jgi:hypothetical protein